MTVSLILKHNRYFPANLSIALKSPLDCTLKYTLSTSFYGPMVPIWLHIFWLINFWGAQEGLAQERKPQVRSVSRFTDICPEISIQGLNLHGLFLDLGGDFQIIFWWWMIFFSVGTVVSHLSRQAVGKPNLTLVSRIPRLWADCHSFFNHQALLARFLSLSRTCLRTVLDSNNLLSFLVETIRFSIAVLATRS